MFPIQLHGVHEMNALQKANLKACHDQIERDLPILLTLFSRVRKTGSLEQGHIAVQPKSGKEKTVQYSLQLQKNDGRTPISNIHLQKGEFYCFWVSHRYPLKRSDLYCLVCPQEPNIRIFVKTDELKTGINYFKHTEHTVFSDGIKIWDYAGLRDTAIKHADLSLRRAIADFKKDTWVDYRWRRKTAQSLWLIKTFKGTPQEYYTKISMAQIYSDNKHWSYAYKNKKTASAMVNKNSQNGKWTMIANASTTDIEYWVIKGDLNVDHKLLLESFVDR